MAFACGHNVIVGFVLLEHKPHRFNIIARESPVSSCVQIAQVELVLQAQFNSRRSSCNFSRNKRLAAPRRLVIKQNSVTCKQTVSFPIVHRLPKAVRLRATIRTSRIKRCLLRLRSFDCLSVHLAAGGLIKLRRLTAGTNRLEQPKRPKSIGIDRVNRHIKTYTNMALRA